MSFEAFQQSTSAASPPFPNCGFQQQQYQRAMSQQQLLRNCFSPSPANAQGSRKRHAEGDLPMFGSNGLSGDKKRPRVSPKKLQHQFNNFHIGEQKNGEQVYSGSSSSDEDMADGDNNAQPYEQQYVVVEEPEEEENVPHFSLSDEAREYLRRSNNECPLPSLPKIPPGVLVSPGALVPYNRANAFPSFNDTTMYGRIEEIEDGSEIYDGPSELSNQVEFPDDDVPTSLTYSNSDSPVSCTVEEADDEVEEMDMD